jgi:hypothetical protein
MGDESDTTLSSHTGELDALADQFEGLPAKLLHAPSRTRSHGERCVCMTCGVTWVVGGVLPLGT